MQREQGGGILALILWRYCSRSNTRLTLRCYCCPTVRWWWCTAVGTQILHIHVCCVRVVHFRHHPAFEPIHRPSKPDSPQQKKCRCRGWCWRHLSGTKCTSDTSRRELSKNVTLSLDVGCREHRWSTPFQNLSTESCVWYRKRSLRGNSTALPPVVQFEYGWRWRKESAIDVGQGAGGGGTVNCWLLQSLLSTLPSRCAVPGFTYSTRVAKRLEVLSSNIFCLGLDNGRGGHTRGGKQQNPRSAKAGDPLSVEAYAK